MLRDGRVRPRDDLGVRQPKLTEICAGTVLYEEAKFDRDACKHGVASKSQT